MAAFMLFFVAAYRTLHMPPPSSSAEPEFQAADSPASAAAPSVPPPPPPSGAAVQRQHRRIVAGPNGTFQTQPTEFDANGVVIREYASGDADPDANGAPALAAVAAPASDSATDPVFVTPPELPKRDSRGLRWIKAMGKALHIVPQKDGVDDAFRAAPNGE